MVDRAVDRRIEDVVDRRIETIVDELAEEVVDRLYEQVSVFHESENARAAQRRSNRGHSPRYAVLGRL